MAAIDDMNVARLSTATDTQDIKLIINELFWNWYVLHSNMKLTKLKFWFIAKTFYVADLKAVFELLFGPNPRG